MRLYYIIYCYTSAICECLIQDKGCLYDAILINTRLSVWNSVQAEKTVLWLAKRGLVW